MSSLTRFFTRGLLLLGAVALPLAAVARNDSPGAVYTISNALDANRVVAFPRSAGGELSPAMVYPTGGKGTGGGLGDQGALALSSDGRWLVVVNAGSDDISVFSVRHHGLVLTDIAPSGGKQPISVTIADNLIYVLNAGGAVGAVDNISGFYLSEKGQLYPLPGSTQLLSGANVGPAQISFARRGDVLVVTEKATNRVDTFAVDDTGRAGPVVSTASAGATPFGFAVSSRDLVFVSEAPASALSSYRIHGDGSLDLVTGSLSNQQAAACWAVLSKNEKFVYTANAANNSISGYRVAKDGSVTLLNDSGFTAATDEHPLDLAVSHDGRFLYSLNTTSHTIVGFRLREDGSLTRVSSIGGVPVAAAGLMAR